MIEPKFLCRKHLLGEHGEIHKHKHNFEKKHNMTGRMGQIFPDKMQERHDLLAEEMLNRGYNHKSKLPAKLAKGTRTQNTYVDSIKGQINILKRKRCGCKVYYYWTQ